MKRAALASEPMPVHPLALGIASMRARMFNRYAIDHAGQAALLPQRLSDLLMKGVVVQSEKHVNHDVVFV